MPGLETVPSSPLRSTIGRKLSIVFLLFMALTAGNLLLAERLYDAVAGLPQLVDDSGRLRFLSQQIAQRAARLVQTGEGRPSLFGSLDDYEAKLAQIERQSDDLAQVAGSGVSVELSGLRREWNGYRAVVGRLQPAPSAADVRIALSPVYAGSDALLQRADTIVGSLVEATQRNHRQVDMLLFLVLVIDLAFLVSIFYLIRRTVTRPLVEVSQALRRFAAGERQARLPIDTRDEIGDLARAFNRTAEDTDHLIRELATKSAILDETSDFVGTADIDGNIRYINPAGLAMLGLEEKTIKGRRIADTHPAWAMAVVAERGLPTAVREGSWTGETALLAHDGCEIPVSQVIIAHRSATGEVAYLSTIMRDISDRIRMENRLVASRDFHLRLFHDFPGMIWRSGTDAGCDYFNKAWLNFTGRSLVQELGDGWADGVHADDREHCLRTYREAFAARRPFETEYRLRHRDGQYRWIVDSGAPYFDMDDMFAGFVGSCHDITERKRYQVELEHQATHDALTGLPNRNLLGDRLEQALVRAARNQTSCAVLFLDLDQFKFVNDSLGHEVGDRLLAEVAVRLRSAVRQGDTVARQGGDEFVIVMAEVAGADDAAEVVQKLLGALHSPFMIDGHELFVTASIGVSFYPQDGGDSHTLLRHADMAMYRAKEEGRNNFQFFAADMNARVFERLSIEGSLRRALEREELLLYYQPQVDLVSGLVVGMEALLRWRHPKLGLVPPVKFIPLAEETGLIVAIGAWVLEKACAQAKTWQDAGLPNVTVGVNLSARQFRHQDIVANVRAVLAETGLDPRYLDLELTESMIMHDPERVIAVLHDLSAMGVQLSVDDFGTGYSSLSYLKRFPIDKVKIDQSFVRDITSDPDDAAIAKTIVSIAHDMRMKVIAEGTETEGQINALRSYGCDEIQGYFFSRPLPPEEFEALLREGRRLPAKFDGDVAERTLLIVDDEPNILNTLMRLLRPDGYRVLRAESGAEALEMLANHKVGVIVSDQRMPGMNGVELLRRAKQIHPDTVRMVLSGYTELKSVTDAINEGAVYKFLTKPWEDNLLRENIREAFQHYELRAENARLTQKLEAANAQLSRAKGTLEVEVEHSIGVLRVSQEMLERLPVGAVGIDLEGVVVTANRKAEEILGGSAAQPLLGALAAERLPAVMAGALERVLSGSAEGNGLWQAPQGGDFGFWCHAMGATSRSKGVLLTIVPTVSQVRA